MKSKDQKRREAMERQRAYEKLSIEQKIHKLFSAPGKSKRQLDRLVSQIPMEVQS